MARKRTPLEGPAFDLTAMGNGVSLASAMPVVVNTQAPHGQETSALTASVFPVDVPYSNTSSGAYPILIRRATTALLCRIARLIPT